MQIIKTLHNGIYDINLSGKFTFGDNAPFREILHDIAKPENQRIIFHMQAIEFIDSAALGMLLLALEAAQAHQKQLFLSSPTGHVKKILEMARFDSMFTMI